MERRWWMWMVLVLLCVLGPAAGATYLIWWENKPATGAVVAATAMFLYFIPYWFQLLKPFRLLWIATIAHLGSRAWWVLPLLYLIPNILFRLVLGGSPTGTLHLVAFLAVPTFFLWVARRHSRAVNWWDLVALVILWLPFDTGWLVPIWQVEGFVGFEAINSIMAVGYYATVFIQLRRLKGIGLEPRFQPSDRAWTCIGVAGALLVILPVGLATDFITHNGQVWPWRMLGAGVGILLMIGIPEELLFRGFMQNTLIQLSGRPWVGIGIMSLFFGIIHANNGPSPDWRFMLLATFVGLLCGLAHHRTQNLTAPVLIHTIVDAIWVGYLQ